MTAPLPLQTPWLALVPGHPLLTGLAHAHCKPATVEEEHQQEEQQTPQFLYDDMSIQLCMGQVCDKEYPPTTY